MESINDTTPVAMLTVGQLKKLITESSSEEQKHKGKSRRYVYGLEGICSLFGCRLNKAEQLKKSIIKDAVSQHGRKIMVDVEKASALYEAATKGTK